MTITEKLDEIQARSDAATKGPWGWSNIVQRKGKTIGFDSLRADAGSILQWRKEAWIAVKLEDAAFIEEARADVPKLVEALRYVIQCEKFGFNFNPEYLEAILTKE